MVPEVERVRAMLPFDRERVLANVRNADTEDLFERVTAYRAGMEPEAIEIIEAELLERGVTAEEIAAHEERWQQEGIVLEDGVVAKCSFCRRPAVGRSWGWHRLWGVLPLFPRQMHYCTDHVSEGGGREVSAGREDGAADADR
jgi:hypothetical protein